MASNDGDLFFPQRSILLALITVLAFALRVQRLAWQPLWWDEGYSVYFATEPLARMVALTARDIHPPVYYAALHGWIRVVADASPATVRLFSIGAGTIAIPLVAALSARLSNRSNVAILVAALLLALNPMHIYYSQEVRMYSAATALALAGSLCLVTWVRNARSNRRSMVCLFAYVGLTLLLIHTLYYAAILVAVQILWAAWMLRTRRNAVGVLLAGVAALFLLSLPWALYAGPRLSAYVANKVQSDQDTSLAFADYVSRHLAAFAAGHVLPIQVGPAVILAAGLLAIIPLLFAAAPHFWAQTSPRPFSLAESVSFLGAAAGAAILFGYLVNLRYPFFPEGGERLLLFALPYLLALLALGVAFSRLPIAARAALLSPLLIVYILGIAGYYTQARHGEQDYRAIVRTVEQRGSVDDDVLALFPWQVGYWRAYGQRDASACTLPAPAQTGRPGDSRVGRRTWQRRRIWRREYSWRRQ